MKSSTHRSVPHDVNAALVGYEDFVRLCRVSNGGTWAPGFNVTAAGVWVVEPPKDVELSPQELATLCEHPKKDLSIPALSFPCTLAELQEFILWGGLNGCVDPEELETFKQKSSEASESDETFVERNKAMGKTDSEIAAALVARYKDITDHRIGLLLPAYPGTHVSEAARRKRGQRLRKSILEST